MDVRCDRCATVYDFDEARIPPEGLSVKCSTCGHVFRAARTSVAANTGDEPWIVRQQNGSIVRFKEMTTLQRWIVERKVARQDEISKSGTAWKRLGDIPDLKPFFDVVERPPVAAAQLIATPTAASPQWEASPQRIPKMSDSGPYSIGHAGPAGHDDELEDELRPKSKKGKWVVALLLVLLVAGGVVFRFKPELFQGGPSEPKLDPIAQQHLQAGYDALLRDSLAALTQARDQFDKAATVAPEWAEAKAAVAQAEINRAEYLREEARELAGKLATLPPAEQPAAKAEVDKREAEAKSRLDTAFGLANEAYKLAPESVAAQRTLADFYRLAGSGDMMRPLLEKARTAAPLDPYVAYVHGASVAGDAALAERAIRYFDEALERAPMMQRARYKLARVFMAQGDNAKALTHAETILQAVPDHDRAQALVRTLKPAPAPVASAPEPAAAPEKKELSFNQLVAQAERLRSSDQAERALSLYERALDMEPEDPDVHSGIGWCHIDLEEPNDAIAAFKEALKLAPRYTDAHMGLAEAYRIKGMKRDAVKHYQVYLDILPDGPDAEVAKRMIQQLNQ